MRRDLDLIRDIMLRLEEAPREHIELIFEDTSPEVLDYHLELLMNSGMIRETSKSQTQDGVQILAPFITMQGHDFLDDVREDSIWVRAKEKAASAAGTASIQVVKHFATEIMKGLS